MTYTITALANALAQQMDEDELAIASVFFTQLGDTLGTISLLRPLCEKKSRSHNTKCGVNGDRE